MDPLAVEMHFAPGRFKSGIAHPAHLLAIDQTRKKTAAILGRIKPVNGFFSETQIVEANRGDVRLCEIEYPMIFSLSKLSPRLGFCFSRQTTAKRTDVDSRAFGIVVRRDVNLDVSGSVMVWPAARPAQPMSMAIRLSFILAKEPHAQPLLHLAQAAAHSSSS